MLSDVDGLGHTHKLEACNLVLERGEESVAARSATQVDMYP